MVRLLVAIGEIQHACVRSSPNLQIGDLMLATTDNAPSGSGKPESIFISWLLWQPRGADLATEALKEVRKLARYEGADPDIARLTALFASLAGTRGPLH